MLEPKSLFFQGTATEPCQRSRSCQHTEDQSSGVRPCSLPCNLSLHFDLKNHPSWWKVLAKVTLPKGRKMDSVTFWILFLQNSVVYKMHSEIVYSKTSTRTEMIYKNVKWLSAHFRHEKISFDSFPKCWLSFRNRKMNYFLNLK